MKETVVELKCEQQHCDHINERNDKEKQFTNFDCRRREVFFVKINSEFGGKNCRDDHLCENTIQKIPKSYMTVHWVSGPTQKEPH